MQNQKGASTLPDQRVLIRRARQLLTLHGASGPRRGAAMRELQIVNDGALLIHNGIIEESGPTKRIENLQKARGAREIDARGKVVMPAFVDPDAVLIAPPAQLRASGEAKQTPLRVLSKRRLEAAGLSSAAAWVRCGALTVGAHSGYADDLRETAKVLRIHQSLQGKPLRIRSIFSPRKSPGTQVLIERWLPEIRKRNLAPVLELTAGTGEATDEGRPGAEELRMIATAAAALGFSLRIRTSDPADAEVCKLALEGGALAIVSDAPPSREYAARLTATGCIHVFSPMNAYVKGSDAIGDRVRAVLNEGCAIAIASSYQSSGPACFNSQHLLHLAKEHLGLSDEEAIVASTWNASCSLRMSHVAGSLEPGKAGDVLIMDVPDYRDLTRRAGHNDVQMALRLGQIIYKRGGLILD